MCIRDSDYIGREPFNIYIMSISGHMDYVFGGGHDICSRYKDEVQDLTELTTPAKAYICLLYTSGWCRRNRRRR